jgi:hypothetical protein
MRNHLPALPKRYLILGFCSCLLSCGQKQSDVNASDSLKVERRTEKEPLKAARVEVKHVRDPSLPAIILGDWAQKQDVRVRFQISKKTIYFPDDDAGFRYDLFNDSVVIHFESSFDDTLKIEIKGKDTLILSNKMEGKSVYHRFKE